jgi:hypothetical protein
MNMEEVSDNEIEVSMPKPSVKVSEDAETVDNFDSAIEKGWGENCSKASFAGCTVCTPKPGHHGLHCAGGDKLKLLLNVDHPTTDYIDCIRVRTPRTPSLIDKDVADLDSSSVKGDKDVGALTGIFH